MRSKRREVLEMAAGLATLEAALWHLGWAQLVWGVAACALMLLLNVRSGWSGRVTGTSRFDARLAFVSLVVATAVAALILWSASLVGTLHHVNARQARGWRVLLYFAWALVQQWMAQSFIFVRMERVLAPKTAVIATATVFAIAHLPNAVLTALTFCMGLVFTAVFRRRRSIYPLALAHGILGLAVAVSLPDALTHHMRVGAAWWVG